MDETIEPSGATPNWTLTRFLDRLASRPQSYTIGRYRDSIMVTVATPGIRWEVEFMDNGGIEVEKFVSSGDIGDEAWISQLLRGFDDD